MIKDGSRHISTVLMAGAVGLAGCHSGRIANNETSADAAISSRLDSLETRVSSLESEERNRGDRRNGDSAVGSSPEESDTVGAAATDEPTNEAFDDQDYQREIQALCAAKGVDCSQ